MYGSKTVLAGLIFVIWVGVSVSAFWWFQFKHIDNFQNQLASFDGSELAQLHIHPVTKRHAIVVHFVDPECPCTRFSLPHIEDLERKLSGRVDFRSASSLGTAELHIPATPAVAIWSASGELAYFGPYSGGAICGTGDDFVTSVFNQLEAGTNPRWINLDAVGCFCPSQSTSKVTTT